MDVSTIDLIIYLGAGLLSLAGSVFVIYSTQRVKSGSIIPRITFHQGIADSILSITFLFDLNNALWTWLGSIIRVFSILFGQNLSVMMAIQLCIGLYFEYCRNSKAFQQNIVKIVFGSYIVCITIACIGTMMNVNSVLIFFPYDTLAFIGIFVIIGCFLRVYTMISMQKSLMLKLLRIPLVLILLWGIVIYCDIFEENAVLYSLVNRIIGLVNFLMYYFGFHQSEKLKNRDEEEDSDETRGRIETMKQNEMNLRDTLTMS